MGKVDVSGNLLFKLGAGFIALMVLISLGGLIIASSKQIDEGEGFLLSLSHATHLDTEEITESPHITKVTYLLLAFGGEVLAFYVFYVLIEFLISGQLKNNIMGAAKMSKIKGLKGHHIICGGGRVGQHLAEKLKEAGKTAVIIESDETKIMNLRAEGFYVINADALNERAMQEAGITNAASIAAVVGNDGDNLLTILAAKEHNPDILVAARANDELIVSKLKHAGANIVILPEVIGGVKLAEAILGDIDENHVIHHKKERKPHAKHAKHTKHTKHTHAVTRADRVHASIEEIGVKHFGHEK